MDRTLLLESIHSEAKFVLYSEKEGVVSEHEHALDAMQKLSILVGGDPDSPGFTNGVRSGFGFFRQLKNGRIIFKLPIANNLWRQKEDVSARINSFRGNIRFVF